MVTGELKSICSSLNCTLSTKTWPSGTLAGYPFSLKKRVMVKSKSSGRASGGNITSISPAAFVAVPPEAASIKVE